MKRRVSTAFNLAFLDVMFCGFGAVILFFMIINASSNERKEKINYVAQAEVDKIEVEVLEEQKHLIQLKNSLQQIDQKVTKSQGLSKEVIENISKSRIELSTRNKETLAKKESINTLKADLISLEEEQKRLEAGANSEKDDGERLRYFAGQGDRQYLTGLKMGGERILILVDTSASMLSDRIINVLRFRNLPAEERIRAAKWQQVLYTVDWISTRIPPTSKFQIYAFNEKSWPVHTKEGSEWLNANNPKDLNDAVTAFYNTAPEKGTSLYHAFASIDDLSPLPDNIYLLTDGLPTQGKSKPFGTKVNAKKRKKIFKNALERLPGGIPLNIILFHMEGDPDASSEYWKLAQRSNGAFFSPADDWP